MTRNRPLSAALASASAGALVFGALGALTPPAGGLIGGLAAGLAGFIGIGVIAYLIASAKADPALVGTDRPGSVELSWIERAASGAFFDLIILLCLGTLLVSVVDWTPPLRPVLATIAAFGLADLGLRRARLAKQEG